MFRRNFFFFLLRSKKACYSTDINFTFTYEFTKYVQYKTYQNIAEIWYVYNFVLQRSHFLLLCWHIWNAFYTTEIILRYL